MSDTTGKTPVCRETAGKHINHCMTGGGDADSVCGSDGFTRIWRGANSPAVHGIRLSGTTVACYFLASIVSAK